MTARPLFEWDPNKAAKNLRAHQISFEEAATAFDDPMFVTVIDEEHSGDEERYITMGISKIGNLLIIAHTDRQDRIRIISARKATRKEMRFYAQTS